MAKSNFEQWIMDDDQLQTSFQTVLREQFMARIASDEGFYLLLSPDDSDEGWMVVLSEFRYWGDPVVEAELKSWCEQYHAVIQGATVSLPDKETALMFKLRWS